MVVREKKKHLHEPIHDQRVNTKTKKCSDMANIQNPQIWPDTHRYAQIGPDTARYAQIC